MSESYHHQPKQAVLAIVVPVYNNSATLTELVQRVHDTLDERYPNFRLLFVVDGSPDDSWEKIKTLAANDPCIAGIRLTSNIGQHRALLAGMSQIQADYYAIIDADLQDPPEHLPGMLQQAQQTETSVFALRKGKYQSFGRMVTSRLFKGLLHLLTGLPYNAGTYFIIPLRVKEMILSLQVAHPQAVIMAHYCSRAISEYHFYRAIRHVGSSAYSRLARVQAALNSIRCLIECRQDKGRAARARPATTSPVEAINLADGEQAGDAADNANVEKSACLC